LRNGNSTSAGWLWDLLVLVITLAAVAALILIGALALGWNSPRPGRPPDWEAPELPRRVEAAPPAPSLLLFDRPGSDFTLEVIARPLPGHDSGLDGYGVVYRAQDPDQYYAFAVGPDGYYAVLRRDGEGLVPIVPWQQFPHIRRGAQSNRLLVTCVGASCAFRINDEYATTVEDDRWLSGDVGLWASSFEGRAAIQVSVARLWALSPGSAAPGLPSD
jgi:hypothetical protein